MRIGLASSSRRPVVDREICMGFGYCTETLPQVFALDDEGKAVVADVPADPVLLDEALDGCPRGAISLEGQSQD